MSIHRGSIGSVLIVAALVLPIAAACGSSTPAATPTPTPASAASQAPDEPTPAPAAAASPGVTIDGSTVTVVGIGRFTSETFQLPPGSATMTITACASNGVMPFITLADGSGQSAGLIVDPEKVLNNLKGGDYTVGAQANPDCEWKVVIVPAAPVAASPAAASPGAGSPGAASPATSPGAAASAAAG